MAYGFEIETGFCGCIPWERDCSVISGSPAFAFAEGIMYATCATDWSQRGQTLIARVNLPSHHHGAKALRSVQLTDPSLNDSAANPSADGHPAGEGESDASRNEARSEGCGEGPQPLGEHPEDDEGDRGVDGGVCRHREHDQEGEAHAAGGGGEGHEGEAVGEARPLDAQAPGAQARVVSGARARPKARRAVVIAIAACVLPFAIARFIVRQLARMFPC